MPVDKIFSKSLHDDNYDGDDDDDKTMKMMMTMVLMTMVLMTMTMTMTMTMLLAQNSHNFKVILRSMISIRIPSWNLI